MNDTPRSVAECDSLLVVMNTGEPTLVSLRLGADGIERVSGGDQVLASDADPAQVGFSPDGWTVVITQRGSWEGLPATVAGLAAS
jgi:6-phosphogluconolactonase